MALPALLRKVFESDGYGPKLNRSVIPFAASLASTSPDDVASADWVKDLSAVSIYVDPNGNDSTNDGLSAGSALQTFAKAIEVGRTYPVRKINIIAQTGTYTGNISVIFGLSVTIYAQGDLTINGNITCYNFSYLVFSSVSYDLTVNGRIEVGKSSSIYFDCPNLLVVKSDNDGLNIDGESSIYVNGNISLTVTNTSNAVSLYKNSTLIVTGNLTATVDITDVAVLVAESSTLTVYTRLLVNSTDSGNNHNNVRAAYALYVNDSSFAYVYRLETSNIFSASTCISDNCSSLILDNGAYLHGPKRSVTISACLAAIHGSSIRVNSSGGGRTDCITHHSSSVAVFSAYGSNLTIYGSILVDTYNYGTGSGPASGVFGALFSSFLALSTDSNNVIYTLGSINAGYVFRSDHNSVISIEDEAVFSGNANANANCVKYMVNRCSVLALYGRNTSNLPGPKPGTTATNGVVA